jgi:AcrR family transcriptional regulator
MLHEEGADALTVRRLAEEVGTSTRAIYALFESKEGLVRALYRAGFETLYRQQSAVSVTGDPVTDLVALAHAYRRTALDNRHLYGLMFDGARGYEPTSEDRQFARRTLVQVRDAVRAGVAAGRLPDDGRAITLELWALVHGLAALELQGILADGDTATRYWTEAVTAFVRGHGRRSTAQR